jgi:hypothetical protein
MAVNPAAYFTIIGLAVFLTGLSKGGLGGTMGALITPILALVMPIDQAIGLLLPVFIVGDAFALAAHWRRWDARIIWLLLPGGLVGITLGTFVLTSISPEDLKRAMAIFIFIFVLYRLFESRILNLLQYRARKWHGWLAGGVAGFASALAHAGGPPVVIYLLMQNLTPAIFAATSILFFAVTNWIKLPYYYQAGLLDLGKLLPLIWLAPLMPLGVWIGRRWAERINPVVFDRIIVVFLTITGIFLFAG